MQVFPEKSGAADVCGGGFMPVFRQLCIRMQAWVIPGMFQLMRSIEPRNIWKIFYAFVACSCVTSLPPEGKRNMSFKSGENIDQPQVSQFPE